MRRRLMQGMKAVENSAPAGAAVGLLERLDTGASQVLRVLTYHRVADPALSPHYYPRVTVLPQDFARQMAHVCARYSVVSMQQVLEAAQGKALPPRPLLITFDDATRDFAENALPVLRRYNLPAAVFVATAYPDQPERVFWWDALYAATEHAAQNGQAQVETSLGRLPMQPASARKASFTTLREHIKALPHAQAMQFVGDLCEKLGAPKLQNDVLSWQELRQLAKQGVMLGAHTQTHPMMSQISAQEIRQETAGSLHDLRREIGDVLPIFAYPSGGYTAEVIQLLREEGIQLAFTTQRGHNRLSDTDWMQIKRINVGPRTTSTLLRAQLLGWAGRVMG